MTLVNLGFPRRDEVGATKYSGLRCAYYMKCRVSADGAPVAFVRRMPRLPLTTVALALAAMAFDARPAGACSPPRDPNADDPPCDFLDLWTPAPSFPRNLEGHIRLGAYDRYGSGALSGKETFDENLQVFVHRVTPTGYEAVPFSLVNQGGLVPYARRLQLDDATPAEYIVSSPDVTCAGARSPVAGTGTLVGQFEIEPAQPLPTELGRLSWLGQVSESQTLELDNSNCGIDEVDARIVHSTLELQLSPRMLPWRDVFDAALYVDGTLERGYSRLYVANDGVATIELDRICSSSDPAALATEPGYGPGMHRLKVVAKVEDLASVESDEVEFTLSCDRSQGFMGGCAAGGDGAAWPFALMFVAFGFIRARSR